MTEFNQQQLNEIVEAVSDKIDQKLDQKINNEFARRQAQGVASAATGAFKDVKGLDQDEFMKEMLKKHLDAQGKTMGDNQQVRDKTGWEKTKSGLARATPYVITALGTIVVAETSRWGIGKIKDKRAAKQAAMEF